MFVQHKVLSLSNQKTLVLSKGINMWITLFMVDLGVMVGPYNIRASYVITYSVVQEQVYLSMWKGGSWSRESWHGPCSTCELLTIDDKNFLLGW